MEGVALPDLILCVNEQEQKSYHLILKGHLRNIKGLTHKFVTETSSVHIKTESVEAVSWILLWIEKFVATDYNKLVGIQDEMQKGERMIITHQWDESMYQNIDFDMILEISQLIFRYEISYLRYSLINYITLLLTKFDTSTVVSRMRLNNPQKPISDTALDEIMRGLTLENGGEDDISFINKNQ